jgi:hypothetical protein
MIAGARTVKRVATWRHLGRSAQGAVGDPPTRSPSIPASTPSRPSLPADPWEPVLTFVSPSPSRPLPGRPAAR